MYISLELVPISCQLNTLLLSKDSQASSLACTCATSHTASSEPNSIVFARTTLLQHKLYTTQFYLRFLREGVARRVIYTPLSETHQTFYTARFSCFSISAARLSSGGVLEGMGTRLGPSATNPESYSFFLTFLIEVAV